VQLYLGDCLQIMPELAGVDAVVTDPPFFVRDDAWDRFPSIAAFGTFVEGWMVQTFRLAPLLVVFFPDKFVPLLRATAERLAIPYRRALVWRKPPGSQFAGASLDGFWYDIGRASASWTIEPSRAGTIQPRSHQS